MKNNSQKLVPVPHREDLANLIIKKSLDLQQDRQADFIYFFVAKPLPRLSAFLMLAVAFFCGFSNASNKYHQQQFAEQKSVIEEIYYSNSHFYEQKL